MANAQMNKTAVIDEIIEKVDGVTKKQVGDVIDALVATVTESVSNGTDVAIPGFGKFTRVERAARTGRNPQTGETIRVPASKAPSFKAGKAFKDAVNR